MESRRLWVRQLLNWKRGVLCRLAYHYPSLLRFLPTIRPLAIRKYCFPDRTSARDLLVFLPGIGDCAADFEAKGLLRLVRQTDWPVDIVTVDAHYGYYADRTILDQLHRDVFLPAQAVGYRHVWLAGISLGGFGALLYTSRYPDHITGVIALAPFLGDRSVIHEISSAGGLNTWLGENATDEVRLLWHWLRGYRRSDSPSSPLMYLGFGNEDSFAEGHRLLAAALPSNQVLVVRGGHQWSVWEQLWQGFLERKLEVPD